MPPAKAVVGVLSTTAAASTNRSFQRTPPTSAGRGSHKTTLTPTITNNVKERVPPTAADYLLSAGKSQPEGVLVLGVVERRRDGEGDRQGRERSALQLRRDASQGQTPKIKGRRGDQGLEQDKQRG